MKGRTKIITVIFMVLLFLTFIRAGWNIETYGQRGNLIWEFGRALRDMFSDLHNGWLNK